ncbi:hypothetical protein PO124_04870 [Bacillus licheniformis]|nr:hypothetical protein [Bacillus licheniformis]
MPRVPAEHYYSACFPFSSPSFYLQAFSAVSVEFRLARTVRRFDENLMRPVFKLPGRSSIDCMASWLGDGTIGVLLTSKQYEEGFYTKREAAVIGTTFSVVSITFAL